MHARAASHLSDSHDPGKTDWVMRNPILFFSIFGSIMLAIVLFCAYCLWRGPTRAFMPCIKKRSKSKSKPTKPHAETGDDLKDPDGILSPDRALGPNLAFWRSSRAASSGDWGHQVYLTDLKRQAEAEAEAERDVGVRTAYDEEAVRYGAAAGGSGSSPVERPRSSLGGQRKSRALERSPMSASPLGGGQRDNNDGDRDRHSSPLSSTLSHSKLIKHRQSSPAPVLALSSTPSSTTFAHSHPRAMSPASTILPNPALPPRHSSLYSSMSTPLFSNHGVPPRQSSTFSSEPGPSSSTSYMSSPPLQYTNVAVNVPPVAKMAYSPFTPRQSMSVPIEEGGPGGQRDSIHSNRGLAV